MSRKTITVEAFRNRMNAAIAVAKTPEVKEALCMQLADILHETDNYNGFEYTFWTFETADKYRTIEDAIKAGVGCEYDRRYYAA